MSFRVCKKCKEEKELTEFLKDKIYKDGYRYTCKACRNAKYIKKGPCKNNSGWFKKDHFFIAGGEKGWFKKGDIPLNKLPNGMRKKASSIERLTFQYLDTTLIGKGRQIFSS